MASVHIRILLLNADTGQGYIASGSQNLGVRPLPGAFSRNWSHVFATDEGEIMFYSAASGAVALGTMTDDTFTTMRTGAFTPGWTHIMEGPGVFLFYNSKNGAGALGQWTGAGFSQVGAYSPGAFSTGWTGIARSLFYDADNGAGAITNWTSAGSGVVPNIVTVKSYAPGQFSTDWFLVVSGPGNRVDPRSRRR